MRSSACWRASWSSSERRSERVASVRASSLSSSTRCTWSASAEAAWAWMRATCERSSRLPEGSVTTVARASGAALAQESSNASFTPRRIGRCLAGGARKHKDPHVRTGVGSSGRKSPMSVRPAIEWNLRRSRSGSYSPEMMRGLSCAGRALICAAVLSACRRAPAGTAIPVKIARPLPPGEPQVRATAVVISRKGKVELQRGMLGGWSDAEVGDRLAPSDALRTHEGEAEVGVDGVKMRGAVESEVEPGKGSVDVEVEGSDTRAHSQGGHFFVTADGRGVVAVAAVTGSVNLTSHGRQVEVRPGTVSRVAGVGPEDASPALRRVLLSVRWPQERATSKDTVPVSGKVEAGSRVFIQGQPIPVEPGGSFRADVPLRDGKQTVAVVAIDAMGRRKQVDTTIVRDQSTPTVRVKRKLWQSR